MQTQRVLDEFKNEPFTDYSKPENAEAMRAAIEKVRGELGREYPVVINGENRGVSPHADSPDVRGLVPHFDSSRRSDLSRGRARPPEEHLGQQVAHALSLR